MPALPSKASFTGSTVTQGQFKTALDSLNDYLTGLLGSDGTATTARTTLGVVNPTPPTYAQVISALGYTPYDATAATGKLDKTGGTMTGNLTIQNTAPTLALQDTDNAVTKYVYHNSDVIGFLSNDASWLMYGNNSGQIWSRTYGWLHDYFFSGVSNCGNCGTRPTNGSLFSTFNNNCTYANCYVSSTSLSDGGSTVSVSNGTAQYQINCNCNCNC